MKIVSIIRAVPVAAALGVAAQASAQIGAVPRPLIERPVDGRERGHGSPEPLHLFVIVTVMITGTATPLRTVGTYRH